MKYLYPFYSEFNNIPIYNYYCWKNPNTTIISPKKISCIFTHAYDIIEMENSYFDNINTEKTVRGSNFGLNIYNDEIEKIISRFNIKKEEINSLDTESLNNIIYNPAQFYSYVFDTQSEMMYDENFKFIEIVTPIEREIEYVTISGRNLNKTNLTECYNAMFYKLIYCLIRHKIKVINLTIKKPNFNFDKNFYQEIDCTENYSLQAQIYNKSKLNIILGVASSPNVHLCCAGNFLVLFHGEDLMFIGNKQFYENNVTILEARKQHKQYLTETSICKQPIHGKETYDYNFILDLIKSI